MVTDKKTYEVTGTLDPVANGIYEDAGEFNEKRYYQRTPDGWSLWWNDIDSWILSSFCGLWEPPLWYRTAPDIEGEYIPMDPATGIATVAEVV